MNELKNDILICHSKSLKSLGRLSLSSDDMAEIIDELVNLREKTRWIPVSDKSPDDAELYLVKTIFDDSHYALQLWDEDNKTWLGDDYSYSLDEVTHYMPIPKLGN